MLKPLPIGYRYKNELKNFFYSQVLIHNLQETFLNQYLLNKSSLRNLQNQTFHKYVNLLR